MLGGLGQGGREGRRWEPAALSGRGLHAGPLPAGPAPGPRVVRQLLGQEGSWVQQLLPGPQQWLCLASRMAQQCQGS